MANSSSQLRFIIHEVPVVWCNRIWGEDTPWIFIVSGSSTHLHEPCAFMVHITSYVYMQDEDTLWIFTIS